MSETPEPKVPQGKSDQTVKQGEEYNDLMWVMAGPNAAEGRVVLFQQDPLHPKGEITVAKNSAKPLAVEASLTPTVRQYMNEGLLMEATAEAKSAAEEVEKARVEGGARRAAATAVQQLATEIANSSGSKMNTRTLRAMDEAQLGGGDKKAQVMAGQTSDVARTTPAEDGGTSSNAVMQSTNAPADKSGGDTAQDIAAGVEGAEAKRGRR
jgi:hypothetical protein